MNQVSGTGNCRTYNLVSTSTDSKTGASASSLMEKARSFFSRERDENPVKRSILDQIPRVTANQKMLTGILSMMVGLGLVLSGVLLPLGVGLIMGGLTLFMSSAPG